MVKFEALIMGNAERVTKKSKEIVDETDPSSPLQPLNVVELGDSLGESPHLHAVSKGIKGKIVDEDHLLSVDELIVEDIIIQEEGKMFESNLENVEIKESDAIAINVGTGPCPFTTDKVFKTEVEAVDWLDNVGRIVGVVLVRSRSSFYKRRNPYIELVCERGGNMRANHHAKSYVNKSTVHRKRLSSTKKCGCQFTLLLKKVNKIDGWTIIVRNNIHNHALNQADFSNTFKGRLKSDEKELVSRLTKIGVLPLTIQKELKKLNPLNSTSKKTIYNERAKLKKALKNNQSNTVPLPSKLVTSQGSSSTPLDEDAVSAQNQSNFENYSGHPAQDSGAALKYVLSSQRDIPATPISVRRILQETKDAQCSQSMGKRVAEELTAEIPLQNKVSRPSGMDTINSKDLDLAASNSWSEMHHCKRSQEMQQSIPMGLSEEHVPQTEVDVAQNAHSFSLTEVVKNMHNTLHDDEEEEAESSMDLALVKMQGYRVKPEMAPLLSKIFNEHGDIASNCKLKGFGGHFLEIVCSLYQKLQNTSFEKIRSAELEEMTDDVNGLQEMGINVTWLRKRLDDISSAIDFLKMYAAMKEKELETKELIDKKEKEIEQHAVMLATLQRIMSTFQKDKSVMEKELLKIKGEAEKIQGMRLNASTFLNNKCLADGLV